jgi:pimeloyl-ACP methyl ester carboxylesterase
MGTENVTSKDGTTLAVDTVGGHAGTPVVLIGGAFNDRSTVAALAAELAPHRRVLTYDRRGRGGSDDRSAGFAVGNEVDDVAAVIAHAGGRAFVFGHSSGAILALEAALGGLPVAGVVAYEPPYRTDPDLPHAGPEVLDGIKALVAAGDRDGAAAYFLGPVCLVPGPGVEAMRNGGGWEFLKDKALTLPYDVILAQPWELVDRERLAALAVPVLAISGDRSEPALIAGARTVGETVPGAGLLVVAGEDHGVLARPAHIAPAMVEFFERVDSAGR